MKCSCSWCSKEIVEGCKSLMGQPTCEDHSFEAIKIYKKMADQYKEFEELNKKSQVVSTRIQEALKKI